jgi:hypothetical protein
MRARWHKLRAWWLAGVATVGVAAVVVNTTVRARCDATNVAHEATSYVAKRPTMVRLNATPMAIRLDCHEQVHEEPNPEPTPVNLAQVTMTMGTTVATGMASGDVDGYVNVKGAAIFKA